MKPKAQTIYPWLKANIGKRCTAPLTGTDARALEAAVQIMELYSYHPSDAVLSAFANVVEQMQTSTRQLAYHCIAHVMNWEDRERLWHRSGLGPLTHVSLCAAEPRSIATGNSRVTPEGTVVLGGAP